MRVHLSLLPIAFIAACTAAEDASIGDEGDMGSTTSMVTKGCSASREEIIAAAGGARAEAITRGFTWWDAKVKYSQGAKHDGYRTDCSGFVSMCWSLEQSYTTADFASGSANNTILGSYEDLQPGDGFVRRVGGQGHAILFLGWDDAKHTQACVLEEASSKTNMQFGVRAVTSLKSQSFKPMRAKNMPDAAPTADDAPAAEQPTGTTTDPTEPTEPTGDDDSDVDVPVPSPAPVPLPTARPPQQGDPCTTHDTCNPLTTGTGLICSATTQTCVPGCVFDLHCPGKLLCKSGVCSM